MSNENMNLIERSLNSKGVEEYEIFLSRKKSYESVIITDKVEIEREVSNFEYVLRILSQKENQTGIGIVKGNSLNPKDIERNIDICKIYADNNLSSQYIFPDSASIPSVKTAESDVIKDPNGIKNDLVEELLSEIKTQNDVSPTFGRFRVHIDDFFLKNSNSVDLNSKRTYFFIEFSLKAQENGKLAEYWPFLFIKERENLNFGTRVPKWAKLAKDSLKAKLPDPEKKVTIIFSPQVLHNALRIVIGNHASGKALHEKLSLFKMGEPIASDNFTIIDNGLLKGGLTTNGWDGEGSPHQRNEVIVNGIFQKRLYDQKYGLLENEKSTGNGTRTNDGAVVNGINNLEILPGNMSFDEMISNINKGYFIEQFSWLLPNPISGIFGSEIRSGYYIENGKIAYPVKLGNVSGSIFKMIKNCLFISKEREFFNNVLFPYIAFGDLTVSS
jgi:PmbA protein